MSKAKPKSDETIVTFLLDKSGSMSPIKGDTIGAFNAYLDTLKESPTGISFSFLQFDTNSVDTIHRNVPVADALSLTDATYQPNGGTPLIDASFKTIKAVESAIAERKGNPPRIVICIQTDGQENASIEHTWADLTALIKAKTALGWQFNFMGCGIDAYAQGSRMGIMAANTMSYERHSPQMTRAAFSASARNTMDFATGRATSTAYSMGQRSAAGDKHIPLDLKAGTAPTKPVVAKRKPIVDDITL